MFLLIFTLFLLLVADLLRVNKQYLFTKDQHLTFHCGVNIGKRTLILMNSDTRCTLQSESSTIQIGSEDQYCIQLQYLALYMSRQCLDNIYINTESSFTIVQQIYAPIDLIKNYVYGSSHTYNSHLINTFTFNIDQEQLLIIELQNYFELIDPFRLILTYYVNDTFIEYSLEQSEIKTYFKLLEVGEYELFIIGSLVYKIYFQKELVSDHFIFSNSAMINIIQNLNFTQPKDQLEEVYLILQIGECDIVSQSILILQEEFLQIELNKSNIYLFKFVSLQIIIKSQPLIIFIRQAQETFIFYPTKLIVINHSKTKTMKFWAKNKILIQTKHQIKIVRLQQQDMYYTITPLENLQLYEFQIDLEILQISHLDLLYVRIHKNTTINCISNLEEYSINKISGQFNYVIKKEQLTISAQSFTTLIFKKRSIDWIDVKLNTVYKYQQSTRFRIYSPSGIMLRVRTFPETLIYAHQDHEQKVTRQMIDYKIKLEKNHQYYTYISAISDKQFYIMIQDTLETIINIPKVVMHVNELQFHNEQIWKLQVISPSKSLLAIDKYDNKYFYFEFNEKESLACLIQYQDKRFIQVHLNTYMNIEQEENYIIYLQENRIMIMLADEGDYLELQLKINNTDINQILNQNHVLEYDVDCLDDQFSISVLDHKMLDLSFFQCQQMDCIIQFSPLNRQIQQTLSLLSCTHIELGMFEMYKYIFTCESLQNMEILQIKGQINIDKANDYIRCKQERCLVYIQRLDQNLSSLEDYELESIIRLNQIYMNLTIQEFIFYNNQSQIMRIHSDQQFKISSINDSKLFSGNQVFLQKGYYYLNFYFCPQYITIFTYPTPLCENIFYTLQNHEDFTLLKSKNKYLILEFYNFSSINIVQDYHETKLIGYQHYMRTPIIDSIITLKGNGSFKILYLDAICYFITMPKLQIYNNKISVEIQLNDECIFKFIQFYFQNNIINSTINIISFYLEKEVENLQNTLEYEFLGNKSDYVVQTQKYTYHLQSQIIIYNIQDEYSLSKYFLTFIILLILYNIARIQRNNRINEIQRYELQNSSE